MPMFSMALGLSDDGQPEPRAEPNEIEQKRSYLALISLAGQMSSVRSEKVTVIGLSPEFQAT
jgi:hypothetical protein